MNGHYYKHRGNLSVLPVQVPSVKQVWSPPGIKKPSTSLLTISILAIAKFFGFFPFKYALYLGQSQLSVKKCSFNYIRCVLITSFATIYLVMQIATLSNSIVRKKNIIDVMAEAQWFSAAVVSYSLAIYLFLYPERIIQLVHKSNSIRRDCGHLFCSFKLDKFARRRFVIYATYTILATAILAMHSYHIPTYPTYALSYFYSASNSSTNSTTNVDQNSIPEWKIWMQTSYVFLVIFWKGLGASLFEFTCCIYGSIFVESFQKIEQGLSEMNGSMTTTAGNTRMTMTESHGNRLLRHLQDFQIVAQVLKDVNSALGPILLIDFIQLIVMICFLVFLPIKYLENLNLELGILFASNATFFLIRLILLITCLGEVYPASVQVNVVFANFLLSHNLDEKLFGPILGHLSVYSANPLSFNACGYFPITKGTLLGSLSIISTYIVVFFQIK